MKIGVVGAGPSGLSAIRHAVDFGCEVIAFEQSDKIGGIWNYSDETDKDKNGLDVHSSIYRGLVSNGPKEISNFPELELEILGDSSYASSEEVLDYLHRYAEKFDLCKHVKFEHHVLRIRPLYNDSWEFIVKNFKKDTYETFHFDAVLICNGYSTPIIPKIPGHDIFKGRQVHSHSYKEAKHYENENILVIGGGPSAVDVILQTRKLVNRLIWSNHMIQTFGRKINISLSENCVEKPNVKRFTENGAEFVDGTFEEVSTILYATGYDFKFPFLSVDCGIQCNEKYIGPLYKHCININRPSMGFIAIPFFAIGFRMFDLQVRFCLTFMTKRKELPTREEMLNDTEAEMEERFKTLPKSKAHLLGPHRHGAYYDDLARTAGIERIEPVVTKLYNHTVGEIFANYDNFRNIKYKIIDEENFEVL